MMCRRLLVALPQGVGVVVALPPMGVAEMGVALPPLGKGLVVHLPAGVGVAAALPLDHHRLRLRPNRSS